MAGQGRAARPLLLELLSAQQLVEEKSLDAAFRTSNSEGKRIEKVLITMGVIAASQIARLYSEHLNLPLVNLGQEGLAVVSDCASLLPEKFLRGNHLLPLRRKEGTLEVAFADPSDLGLINEIQLHTGLMVTPVVAPLDQLERALDLLLGERNLIKETAEEACVSPEGPREEPDHVLDLDQPVGGSEETLVIRLVNHVLKDAIAAAASDIHLEPCEDGLKVRLRIDGLLKQLSEVPRSMAPALISRLKILAKLDIAEKRVPLDGAFTLRENKSQMDVRVSTMPTIWGEKVVMRLLNKSNAPIEVQQLGMSPRQLEDFTIASRSAHGLMFVTGPTGSGKSTTLYATLNLLKSPTKNIVTVEDPVEFKASGVNQVNVKANIGLTFASVLRSFLRQDPDVIMVGEVRDSETAEICMRAALTGHLVLSTLHTNDALSSVTRLIDLKIPAFLIAATLRLIVAQRLVRRLCPECREPYAAGATLAARHGFSPDQILYRGRGCDACRGLGYRGRLGIYEIIRITPVLASLIQEEAPLSRLREAVQIQGMWTLAEHGLDKVKEGTTSLEEVLRATMGD